MKPAQKKHYHAVCRDKHLQNRHGDVHICRRV